MGRAADADAKGSAARAAKRAARPKGEGLAKAATAAATARLTAFYDKSVPTDEEGRFVRSTWQVGALLLWGSTHHRMALTTGRPAKPTPPRCPSSQLALSRAWEEQPLLGFGV